MLITKNNLSPDQKDIDTGTLNKRSIELFFNKGRVFALCFLLLIILLGAKSAQAKTYTWVGSSGGNWNAASNWLSATGQTGSGRAIGDITIINTISCTGGSKLCVFNPVVNRGESCQNTVASCGLGVSIRPNLQVDTPMNQNMYNQIIRLKLSIDSLNFDDIVIGFNPNCSGKYNTNVDAKYMVGMSAPEGLASFSTDSVPLSINFLPYPKSVQEVIRLKVNAANSGQFDLKRTVFANIPLLYEVWLVDNFKKDSLDIRNNSDYIFTVDKRDSTTFGNNRFTVVIRQNQALMVHLLSFNGTKSTGGSQLVWTTENEQNYTNFAIERSADNGVTFNVIGGFISSAQGTYSLVDKNPAAGVNSYQLKMTDLNGSVTYSEVIDLNYSSQNEPVTSNISVYPNPASSVINLSVNQAGNSTTTPGTSPLATGTLKSGDAGTGNPTLYDIRIVNIAGTVIKIANAADANWQTNVDSLAPGSYIIQVVKNDDKSLVGRRSFIKL